MEKEKLKKLIDDLASAGYFIKNINFSFNRGVDYYYGDAEILLYPDPKPKNYFSTEKLAKLFNIFYSLGFGIVEYKLLCGSSVGDVYLILQSLPKDANSSVDDEGPFIRAFKDTVNRARKK